MMHGPRRVISYITACLRFFDQEVDSKSTHVQS